MVGTIDEAIEKAKLVLADANKDADELQKATDELLSASYKIAEHLYKQAEQNKTEDGATQSTETNADQDPIETEIS